MAATKEKRVLRGFEILTCALLVNLTRSTSAEHSSALSHLYKVAEKNRPVVLVLNSDGLNRDQEVYSHESYSKHRKPQYHNNKDDDDRRNRYRNDKDRQDDRQDFREYRDVENRNKNSRHRNDNDRRIRYRNDRDREDDREYRNLENQDDRNKNNRYRDRKDQQYEEKKDRYRSKNREDRKYRNRYYKEQSRLRTGNQEQVQGDQDRNRQQMEGTASAQIPVVKGLLRSLRCRAKDECEDACDSSNSCEDECAQQYECNTPPPCPKC